MISTAPKRGYSPVNDWRIGKCWADRFMPEIKSILGAYLIKEAPIVEDAERNTDLVTLTLGSLRVACRVRGHRYIANYSDEFTIRSSVPTGNKTEFDKIKAGWGEYLFYGFADERDKSLHSWYLADLHIFRSWYTATVERSGEGKLPGIEKTNPDGKTKFRVFKWVDLPDEFIIGSSEFAARNEIPPHQLELLQPV